MVTRNGQQFEYTHCPRCRTLLVRECRWSLACKRNSESFTTMTPASVHSFLSFEDHRILKSVLPKEDNPPRLYSTASSRG